MDSAVPSGKLKLLVTEETLGICRLPADSKVPDWAMNGTDFYSVTRTPDELSIVCPQKSIPQGVKVEGDWRALKVCGPLDFALTGVVSSLTLPLSDKKISVFVVSTYETDYLMVKVKDLEKSLKVLGAICDLTG